LQWQCTRLKEERKELVLAELNGALASDTVEQFSRLLLVVLHLDGLAKVLQKLASLKMIAQSARGCQNNGNHEYRSKGLDNSTFETPAPQDTFY